MTMKICTEEKCYRCKEYKPQVIEFEYAGGYEGYTCEACIKELFFGENTTPDEDKPVFKTPPVFFEDLDSVYTSIYAIKHWLPNQPGEVVHTQDGGAMTMDNCPEFKEWIESWGVYRAKKRITEPPRVAEVPDRVDTNDEIITKPRRKKRGNKNEKGK